MFQKIAEQKNTIIITLVLISASFMIGRYTTPSKVVTKIQEKVVEKEVVKWKTKTVKDESKNKETIITETKLPDGTVKREIHIVDKGVIKIDSTKDGTKTTDVYKTVEIEKSESNQNNDWHVSLLAKVDKDKYTTYYGAHIERRIIGPFYLGVFGIESNGFGLSLGGSF